MRPARAGAAVALALLAACSRDGATPAATAERIACAPDGAAAFATDCAVERSASDGGQDLVVYHPDGAFRRLTVRRDGRVTAADGADAARIAVVANQIEVTIADDRYRIPYTVKPDAAD